MNRSPSCSVRRLGYVWSLYPLVFGRGGLGGGGAGRLAPPGGVQVAWPLGSDSPHGHQRGFHAPPEPSLDREWSSVHVWGAFSDRFVYFRVFLPSKREFQNFRLCWMGLGYLRVINSPCPPEVKWAEARGSHSPGLSVTEL